MGFCGLCVSPDDHRSLNIEQSTNSGIVHFFSGMFLKTLTKYDVISEVEKVKKQDQSLTL